MCINIGSNIRNLRLSNGETQQQLANALHVGANTISRYENGKLRPDMQILCAIAAHYQFPLLLLVKENIGNDAKTGSLTWQTAARYINTQYPFITTKKAMNNAHFLKAKDFCLAIPQKIFQHGEMPSIHDYRKAEEELYIALNEYDLLEAAAGLVWLRIFRFSLIQEFNAVYSAGKFFVEGCSLTKIRSAFVQHPESEETKKKKQEYIDQYFDETLHLIVRLKCSGRFSNIGDYYLGLLYLVGLCNSVFDREFDQLFAIQHFCITAEMGNPYSEAYLSFVDET